MEDEAKAELAAYEKFACFCRDKNNDKSDSINHGHHEIDDLSSDIADKTQEKKDRLGAVYSDDTSLTRCT